MNVLAHLIGLSPVLADLPWRGIFLTVAVILAVVLLIVAIYASRFRKVGPNEVLIVFGKKHTDEKGVTGFRVVKGGGTFIWPIFEDFKILSLELMTDA